MAEDSISFPQVFTFILAIAVFIIISFHYDLFNKVFTKQKFKEEKYLVSKEKPTSSKKTFRRNRTQVASQGNQLHSIAPSTSTIVPKSVNYHFTRQCNYKCGFCFHTAKTSFVLPLEEAKQGLKMLKEAGKVLLVLLCLSRKYVPPMHLPIRLKLNQQNKIKTMQ